MDRVMRPSSYAAVLFDLDNTLLDFDRCESEVINAGLVENDIHLGASRLREFLKQFEVSNSRYWPKRNEIGLHSVVSKSYSCALRAIGLGISDTNRLADSYLSTFSTHTPLEPHAMETIRALSRAVRLAVVTNGVSPIQEHRLAASGLAPCFEHVVVSDAVGYAKPEPMIFRIVLDRMRLLPSHVLYVGDSITYDYRGAREAHIDFCWYNRNGSDLPDGASPQFSIGALSELIEILS